MADGVKVETQVFDYGARIGIAVEYRGVRRTVTIDNPLWPEITTAMKQEASWKTA